MEVGRDGGIGRGALVGSGEALHGFVEKDEEVADRLVFGLTRLDLV